MDGHCITVRELTCFCFHCVQANWRHCLNKGYILNWEYHTLNDKEATDREAEKKEDFIYQGLGDTLSNVIHVGDNFAVNAELGNSEGADFYILLWMLGGILCQPRHSTSKEYFMQGWMIMIMCTGF